MSEFQKVEMSSHSSSFSRLDVVLATLAPDLRTVNPRVLQSQIEKTFHELDLDKSGTLDHSELRAFLQGRFELSSDCCEKVFKKFDNDRNNTIDLAEFSVIIEEINGIVIKFDEEDLSYHQLVSKKVCLVALFEYCCCPCTIGISCCLGQCYLSTLQAELTGRVLSSGERLNDCISNGLTMSR